MMLSITDRTREKENFFVFQFKYYLRPCQK